MNMDVTDGTSYSAGSSYVQASSPEVLYVPDASEKGIVWQRVLRTMWYLTAATLTCSGIATTSNHCVQCTITKRRDEASRVVEILDGQRL